MQLLGKLFSESFQWAALAIYLPLLLLALKLAYWPRMLNREQFNVFFGSCLVLMLLWHVRAQIDPSWSYHLLGVTTLTLMLGWSYALLASGIALAAVTFNLGHGWDGYCVNALILGVIPITLTQFVLVLVRSLLPKNFFIYVLGNGFLTGGFVAVVSAYIATSLLVFNGTFSALEVRQNIMPFFPLMFVPEAILNGWIITILVLYRPHWVVSFNDDLYLRGK